MRWHINRRVLTWPGLSPAAKIAWHQLSAQLEHETGHLHGAELITSTAAIADAQGLPKTSAWRVIRELETVGLIAVTARRTGRAATLTICVQKPRPNVPPADRFLKRSTNDPPAERFSEPPSAHVQPPQPLAAKPRPRGRPQDIQGGAAPHSSIPAHARERGTVETQSVSSYRRTVLGTTTTVSNGARGPDEIHALKTIGAAIAEVLARVPDQVAQKARLADQLARWIHDPTMHPSIPARVAEAIVLDQVPYDQVARTLVDVLAMRHSKTGLKKPAGALWIHLLKRRGILLPSTQRRQAQ
jgi:hypothetical protein